MKTCQFIRKSKGMLLNILRRHMSNSNPRNETLCYTSHGYWSLSLRVTFVTPMTMLMPPRSHTSYTC